MPQGKYLPEGQFIGSEQNKIYTSSHAGMEKAQKEGRILEAKAMQCSADHDLIVDINGMEGIIPKNETAIGIAEGATKDIAVISRVGKPVCFKVIGSDGQRYILSRRRAQQEALDFFMQRLRPGEVVRARVTHMENFGVFVDIGCGNVSLIGIENISVSRIAHPKERFALRQDIYAVVSGVDREQKRIMLSHKELLGTWSENASSFHPGVTVGGVVRGVEDYGVFIELAPNLSGLAEKREGLVCGQRVAVYIKSIIPQRMKIKLIVIDELEKNESTMIKPEDYYITDGKIDSWCYSPQECDAKRIMTEF